MIVSWPKGIKANDGLRTQWHHVIDVAPTVLEAAKLPEPKGVNGTIQAPIEGVSMLYSFNNPTPREHTRLSTLRSSQIVESITKVGLQARFIRHRGRPNHAAS